MAEQPRKQAIRVEDLLSELLHLDTLTTTQQHDRSTDVTLIPVSDEKSSPYAVFDMDPRQHLNVVPQSVL